MVLAFEILGEASRGLMALTHLDEELGEFVQGDALFVFETLRSLMALGGLLTPIHLLVTVAHCVPHT